MNDGESRPVDVSVVIPTHQGAQRIEDAVASLASQTLGASEFEVVVVVNGPSTGYAEVMDALRERFPTLRLRVEFCDRAGAGHARNVGLALSVGRFVTYLDDDDWLQPRFLELGLAAAGDDRVVVLPLVDQVQETGALHPSPYGTQTRAADGQVVPLVTRPWTLMFNACKIVARDVAVRFHYDEDLRSGEDLVYFSNLLTLDLLVVFAYAEDAHYVRRVRAGSVSRQDTSFDFLVTQRLACIKLLDRLDIPHGSQADDSRLGMMRSQANSLVRWWGLNPAGREAVVSAVEEAGIERFPPGLFNKGQAEDLAFLPSFTPDAATDDAKALVARGQVVDVISADRSGGHPPDLALPGKLAEVLDTHTRLDVPADEAASECVAVFAFSAALAAERRHGSKPYRRLYSRTSGVGSHAAGALFKLRHWELWWTAEFSDALGLGAEGAERSSLTRWDVVTDQLRGAIGARGFERLRTPTISALTEVAALILADEVVFISSGERDAVLDLWDDDALRRLVMPKSLIRVQPGHPDG